MAAAKYKQYYQKMREDNAALFDSFSEIHALYQSDQASHQQSFNDVGQKVVDRVRDWDRRLCSAMGKGMYSQFSQKLSEKFWDLVRADFPLIDKVGVVVKQVA